MLGGLASLASLGLSGCLHEAAAADDSTFEVQVRIVRDGRPLSGASLVSAHANRAVTDVQGRATLRLSGHDGDSSTLELTCPAGFIPDRPALSIVLHRMASGSPPVVYEASCTPILRTVVIGVRAEGGANVPLVYLGKVVARTDSSGAAHVVLAVKPGEQVQLVLDTTGRALEGLRPKSPTLSFSAKDRDDFVILEQRFTVEKKFIPMRAAPARPTPL
ncbi:MAG: hypothetical protein NVS3B20_25270 [Polyangiales bacterium]